MYYQSDWYLRQIEMMSTFVARLIFKRENPIMEFFIEENQSTSNILHLHILELLKRGEVNKAEDMLFDMAEESNIDFLDVANDFYARLNKFTDEELMKMNFSREEVHQGLESFMKKYGVELIGG